MRAARQAGALLAAHVGAPRVVQTKRSPIDLVTDVDRASELLIHHRLLKAFPDHGFYGEEHPALREAAPYQWIVDPLDGTMNFVHGLPLFGVSIALTHRGAPVVGVIYDPMRRELFWAIRGRGAFANGRRLAVSKTPRLETALLSTGFSSTFRRDPHRSLAWFQAFESRSRAVRRIGSTVLSLAYLAAGRLDGFYEQSLGAWDMAAGLLLVEEAGGRTSDFAGGPTHLAEGQLVASNRRIHREMLQILRSTQYIERPRPAPGRR